MYSLNVHTILSSFSSKVPLPFSSHPQVTIYPQLSVANAAPSLTVTISDLVYQYNCVRSLLIYLYDAIINRSPTPTVLSKLNQVFIVVTEVDFVHIFI